MNDLLNRYLAEDDTANALLVAQNLFNKDKGNKTLFEAYFMLLYKVADGNHPNASDSIERMAMVLSLFSENADLDEETIACIRKNEEKLNQLISIVQEETSKQKAERAKKIILDNDSSLREARALLESLHGASDRDEFNKILEKIYDLDSKIDQDNFVGRQQNEYRDITSDCQKIVDRRLKDFDRLDNIDYNERAIAAYEKILNVFNGKSPDAYKPSDFVEMFRFDPARLTSETLAYYNYVYGYILSKLDDKGKLAITRLAIKTEKEG